MDRRELFGALGALGAGLAGSESPLNGGDHEDKKDGLARFLAPVQNLHAHFCGIHVAKNNQKFQLVAQHYCAPRGADMHQCLLFDSCAKDAKLLGVEYIISDELYRSLSEKEKMYWHPHTYEVLAGGLIAPGMKAEDELKFMKAIINTWGKTWHTWPDPTTKVPIGEPLLMWSLTADGQEDRNVIAARDRQFGVATAKIREQRLKDFGLEVPNVSFPTKIEQVGRQWTDNGDDKPTRRP
jgi:hypothetical protein